MLVTPDTVWWGRNFNSAICCPKPQPQSIPKKNIRQGIIQTAMSCLWRQKENHTQGKSNQLFYTMKMFYVLLETGPGNYPTNLILKPWSYLMNVQYQPNGKVTNPSVNPMKFISSPDELKPFILIRRDNILKEMKTSGHKKSPTLLCIKHRYT